MIDRENIKIILGSLGVAVLLVMIIFLIVPWVRESLIYIGYTGFPVLDYWKWVASFFH